MDISWSQINRSNARLESTSLTDEDARQHLLDLLRSPTTFKYDDAWGKPIKYGPSGLV